MDEQFQTVKRDMPGMGLKEIFFKYVRFLPLIIISVALALVGAYLYLRYAKNFLMVWISFSLITAGLPFQYTKLTTPSVIRIGVLPSSSVFTNT